MHELQQAVGLPPALQKDFREGYRSGTQRLTTKDYMAQIGFQVSLTRSNIDYLLMAPLKVLGEVNSLSLALSYKSSDLSVCLTGQKVRVIEDLEDTAVQEGSSAKFCCRISPADYSPVHWFLDKTPLHSNELNEITAQPGGYHVLTLRQLALKDSGTVYFEAGDQRTSAALRVTGGFCV